MKMKLKKTLRAVSAAAVGAGAIMVLGLAGQSLALAQSGGYPVFDGVDNGASDGAAFTADIQALCAIPTASQPFGGAASDPDWNCGDTIRTYP